MRVRAVVLGAAAVAAAAFVAPTSGAGAASPGGVVTSDGSTLAAQEAVGGSSGSYSGTGGPTTELKVDLSGTRVMTANGLAGPTGESIIGFDSRVRVNPTNVYPARANVLITFNTPGGSSRCTGFMIGTNTVATAGHCVHRGSGGTAGFYSQSSYRIYPGYNGTVAPYGVCTARTLYASSQYASNANDQFDWGAIKLSSSCNTKGNTTGWFGFTTTMAVNQGTTIGGYPGDKPLTQWRSIDRVRLLQTNRVFYQNDTVGGMSGSAVVGTNGACSPCAIAVHAYGIYGIPPFSTNNHGTRITPTVFNALLTIKNLP
jgi:glutamyl endopeptidase